MNKAKEPRCIETETQTNSVATTKKTKERQSKQSDDASRFVRQLRNRCIVSLDDQHTNQNMDKAREPRCIETRAQTNSMAVKEKTNEQKREPVYQRQVI